MDGGTLRRRLEADRSAALALLGSPQFLRAAAGGDPAPEPLLEAAAGSEHAAHETFSEWVADEPGPEARDAFESVVEQEREHRERVVAELGGWTPADGGPGPMHAYLRGRDTTVGRIAGGMVGRPLVTLRTHERLISFFEARDGDDAARRAALFGGLRAETAEVLGEGLALLDDRCEGEKEWETARMIADYTVRVAADDTADALRSLGIDPEFDG